MAETERPKRIHQFGPFRIEPAARLVFRDGEIVQLPPKAVETLLVLIECPGQVVDKETLLSRVWPDTFVEENNLAQNISLLRRVLHCEGGPRIETVPKRGYRFVAPAGSPKPVRRKRAKLIAAVFVLLAMTAAVTLYQWTRVQPTRSVAVLPFQNLSGSSQDEYLVDGLTELLIGTLAKGGVARVISRTTSMQFRNSSKKLPEIARELQVDAVIEGSVVRSGDHLRITVQLIHAATDEHVWSEIYDRDMKDLPDLDLDIARAIAREVGIRINTQAKVPRPVARAAFEEYLRGRHAWNKRSPAEIKKAIAHFQRAIDVDAAYAAPYAGLADAYNQLGTHLIGERPARETRPLAIAAARKAIEIDEGLAEAHAALGYSKMYDWDWSGAERELRRAIEINPSYGPVRIWYSSWLAQQDRHPEAVAQALFALDLDPLSLIVRTQVGWTYSHAGEVEQAMPYFRDVLEKDPNYLWGQWQLGQAYLVAGNYPEAVAVLEKAAVGYHRTPALLGSLGAAYARAGRKADAEAILRELSELSASRYVSPHAFTWVYLGLRDGDRAFESLEREYEDRSNSIAWNGSWHMLDGYRSDPRYVDLMRRVGLWRK
ncbi:MAG: winged helix-turn-helix domain-containing protein [Bryobacterales bacterium]